MKNTMQFLTEVKVELSKVTWPKYDEWVGSTIIVIVLAILFAIYLGIVDYAFSKLAGLIFKNYSLF
jgi:preprotein translocase subunit SecE